MIFYVDTSKKKLVAGAVSNVLMIRGWLIVHIHDYKNGLFSLVCGQTIDNVDKPLNF